jgi:hypothetical protein
MSQAGTTLRVKGCGGLVLLSRDTLKMGATIHSLYLSKLSRKSTEVRRNNVIDIEELRMLMIDKYTAAEIVERIDMSTEELLDIVIDTVYNNIILFDELSYLFNEDIEEDN